MVLMDILSLLRLLNFCIYAHNFQVTVKVLLFRQKQSKVLFLEVAGKCKYTNYHQIITQRIHVFYIVFLCFFLKKHHFSHIFRLNMIHFHKIYHLETIFAFALCPMLLKTQFESPLSRLWNYPLRLIGQKKAFLILVKLGKSQLENTT